MCARAGYFKVPKGNKYLDGMTAEAVKKNNKHKKKVKAKMDAKKKAKKKASKK